MATHIAAEKIDSTLRSENIDLVSASLGAHVLAFSDEWFAAASNLLNPAAPVRKPGYFTHTGAWYDGWETRRHNPTFDWVVIRLGVASGRVAGVEIDTAHFNGNHAPEIAVQGCFVVEENEQAVKELSDPEYKGWQSILEKQVCGPNQRQAWLLPQPTEQQFTHVRLQMFPDGGIARFRLYGTVVPVTTNEAVFDLAAVANGGVALSCSDQHFGSKDNLLLPGRGKDMGDGWETKRTRGVHVDWAIIKLGVPGVIKKLVVDTAHYRGNFPQKVQVFAATARSGGGAPAHDDHNAWVQILAPSKTGPDKEHEYDEDILEDVTARTYAYVKLVIIPDGGVKRLRVFGSKAQLT